jgi:hypothetical protein
VSFLPEVDKRLVELIQRAGQARAKRRNHVGLQAEDVLLALDHPPASHSIVV